MNKLIVNCETGEQEVVPMTQEEIDTITAMQEEINQSAE